MTTEQETSRLIAAKNAIAGGLVGFDETTPRSVILIDWQLALEATQSLHRAFPSPSPDLPSSSPRFLHCFAAKANPIAPILAKLHKEGGMGVEAASLGELQSALRAARVPPEYLVFDSPIKTVAEIRYALEHGVFLNLDNFQELERIIPLLPPIDSSSSSSSSSSSTSSSLASTSTTVDSKLRLGLRINPQVGCGSLLGFSTGGHVSKFGIPIEQRAEIIAAYQRTPQLNALHVHSGSQGMSFSLQVAAVRAIVDLALEINRVVGRNQVHILDIGGGLSVNFLSDEVSPTFQQYADALREGVPELFAQDSPFSLVVTEFGRAVLAKAGFSMCCVEYTKTSGGRHFAAIHGGADLFVRTVYLPEQWPLRVHLLDAQGRPKAPVNTVANNARESGEGEELFETDISGPCCFSMDVVAHRRRLPRIEPGDMLLLLDTGAYFHSSFSLYNSRQAPAVYLYNDPSSLPDHFVSVCPPHTVDMTLHLFNSLPL